MNVQDDFAADEKHEPDTMMHYYVFMMVFWPVSILLGLIDYYSIRDHDLRVLTLLLGVVAGWIAMKMYQARERKQHEATE